MHHPQLYAYDTFSDEEDENDSNDDVNLMSGEQQSQDAFYAEPLQRFGRGETHSPTSIPPLSLPISVTDHETKSNLNSQANTHDIHDDPNLNYVLRDSNSSFGASSPAMHNRIGSLASRSQENSPSVIPGPPALHRDRTERTSNRGLKTNRSTPRYLQHRSPTEDILVEPRQFEAESQPLPSHYLPDLPILPPQIQRERVPETPNEASSNSSTLHPPLQLEHEQHVSLDVVDPLSFSVSPSPPQRKVSPLSLQAEVLTSKPRKPSPNPEFDALQSPIRNHSGDKPLPANSLRPSDPTSNNTATQPVRKLSSNPPQNIRNTLYPNNDGRPPRIEKRNSREVVHRSRIDVSSSLSSPRRNPYYDYEVGSSGDRAVVLDAIPSSDHEDSERSSINSIYQNHFRNLSSLTPSIFYSAAPRAPGEQHPNPKEDKIGFGATGERAPNRYQVIPDSGRRLQTNPDGELPNSDLHRGYAASTHLSPSALSSNSHHSRDHYRDIVVESLASMSTVPEYEASSVPEPTGRFRIPREAPEFRDSEETTVTSHVYFPRSSPHRHSQYYPDSNQPPPTDSPSVGSQRTLRSWITAQWSLVFPSRRLESTIRPVAIPLDAQDPPESFKLSHRHGHKSTSKCASEGRNYFIYSLTMLIIFLVGAVALLAIKLGQTKQQYSSLLSTQPPDATSSTATITDVTAPSVTSPAPSPQIAAPPSPTWAPTPTEIEDWDTLIVITFPSTTAPSSMNDVAPSMEPSPGLREKPDFTPSPRRSVLEEAIATDTTYS